MFKAYVIAMALVLNLSQFVSAQLPKKKKVVEDPEKAIVDAIKLLESKDHVGFVKRFYSPKDLAGLVEIGISTDDIAKEEVRNRAEKWLREFKLVKGTKPVFNEGRTQATFNAKNKDGKSVRIPFKLVDGKWYLK